MNKKGFIFGAMIEMLSYFLIVLILIIFVFFFRGSAAESQQIEQINEDIYYTNLLNGYLSSKVLVNDVEMSVSDVVSLMTGQGFFDNFLKALPFSFLFYDDVYENALYSSSVEFFVRPDSDIAFSINVRSGKDYFYKNSVLDSWDVRHTVLIPNKDFILTVDLVEGPVAGSVLEGVKGERDAFLKKSDYSSYLIKRNTQADEENTFSVSVQNPSGIELDIISDWNEGNSDIYLDADFKYIVDELSDELIISLLKANLEFNKQFKIYLYEGERKEVTLIDEISVVREAIKQTLDQDSKRFSIYPYLEGGPAYNTIFKGLLLSFYRQAMTGQPVGDSTSTFVACKYFKSQQMVREGCT